jgi:virulence factor Mce-like protein
MRSRWNFLIVLVYAGIAFTALTYMAINMAGPCALSHCLTLNAEFKDGAGLLPTDDVVLAGTRVGQVTKIVVDKNVAKVTMQVQGTYLPIYRDTKATVRPRNLLGVTVVEIDRGTEASGELTEGETIPLINTLTPVQVDEVLNAFDADTRSRLQIILNALGEATAQRGQDFNMSAADLRRVVADLAVTSTSLNNEKATLDQLLVQFDLVMKTASDYHEQLAQVLRDWNAQSQTLMAHDQNLADALGHIDNVVAAFDTAITPNTQALTTAVSQLPTTVHDATDFLGISSQITDTFINSGALQDGINLFPRLSQVMLGANRCDTHIYANGYHNTPGTTESAGCSALALGSLQGERFAGHPTPGKASADYGDRHLWRVMGILDPAPNCGITSPGSMKPTDAQCSPGNSGLGNFSPNHSSNATSLSSSNSAVASAAEPNFFQMLWSDLFGSGNA